MARLNTRTSATPRLPRSSTVDSLYRDPSVDPRARPANNDDARPSSYSVLSPSRSPSSDKENETPETRDNTPRPMATSKRAAPSDASDRLPTPASDSSHYPQKRPRTCSRADDIYEDGEDEQAGAGAEGEDEGEGGGEGEGEDEDENGLPRRHDADGDRLTRYYDPNQNPEERRQVRVTIRNHHRDLDDNRDELLRDPSRLAKSIQRSDRFFEAVKQTADASLDSRYLLSAADLHSRQINNTLQGNGDVGVNVDQFVSKCILFMKTRGNTADGHVPVADADDDADDDDGDGLDWAFLGRGLCFAANKRPPTASFLLGPLSVQKKRMKATQRRARSQRQPLGPTTRPQEIKESDIKQSENSNLTQLVTSIKNRLEQHIAAGEQLAQAELEQLLKDTGDEDDGPKDEDVDAACKRQRLYPAWDGEEAEELEACVSLFDFVVNPDSFGQTVENLFYVSFLIREGNAKVVFDRDGLPLLAPSTPRSVSEQRELHTQKRQAVFSIDYQTWQDLIEAFDIQEPLIPHRVPEETNITAAGWYG